MGLYYNLKTLRIGLPNGTMMHYTPAFREKGPMTPGAKRHSP